MPKIRGIKPETWTDEKFVELSAYARLLWLGLWNHACDNGHLQDKPTQIRLRILPTDDVDCDALLGEIQAQGLIERRRGWITIPNLSHHQKPHKRWWTTCDAPGCELPEGAMRAPSNRGTTVAPPKRNRGTTDDVDCEVDGEGDGDKNSVVAIAPTKQRQAHPGADQLCERLATRIAANGSRTPAVTEAWRKAARLLLDRDQRPLEEALAVVDWCQADPFWRSNILSMPKFREKYDQLRLKAQPKPSNVQSHMALAAQLAEAEA